MVGKTSNMGIIWGENSKGKRGGLGLGLDQVGHIHGHLLHSGVVEGLNVSQSTLVILSHHVDGYTLPAETTTSANPKMDKRKLMR